MLSNWLDASSSSNRHQQTYIKGFLDISGGNLILRNNNFHLLKGDASLNGRLLVNGDVSLNNRLFVNGDVSLNGNLTIKQDLTLLGNLFANYAANSIPITAIQGGVPGTDGNFLMDVSINHRLFVQKDASLNANLYVKSKTILNGDVSMNGRLFISGNASFINLNTTGNAILTNVRATNIYENGTPIYAKYAPINAPTFTGTVSGITSAMVGLGNVNNTADLDKPISTATQNALNLYAPLASPALTGIPTAPTAAYSTNTYQVATTAYVVTQISGYNVTLANKYASVNNPNFIGSATVPTLLVTSDASLNNRLYVNNDASMNGNLRVGKTIFEGGKSLITKYATLASPTFTGIATIPTAIINDSLVTLGDASLNNRLFIAGDSSFNSNVFVAKSLITNSDSTFNKRVFVAGDTSLNSNVYIGKDLTVNGNLVVNTYTSQQTVTSVNYQFIVAEDMSLNGRLFTTGDVSLNSSLFIGGDTSMNGNLAVLGNLTAVTQESNNNSTLVATTAYVQTQGYAKLAGAKFTGDVSMNSNLQVIGNLIAVTQGSTDNSTLVATTEFIHNKLTELVESPIFSGETTTDSFTVKLDASLNGNLHVGQQIYEAGNSLITKYSTLASPTFTGSVSMPDVVITQKLSSQGDISLNRRLFVGGDVSLNKNLFIAGNANVIGKLTAVTPTSTDSSTLVATTEFVHNKLTSLVASPTFSGGVTADALTVNLDASLNSNLHVGQEIYEAGNSLITKYATLASPTFTGSVSMPEVVINQNLVTYGDNTVNSRLVIQGDASLNSNLTVAKQITIVGDSSMGGNVTIGKDLNVIGNLNVGKTLTKINVFTVSYEFIVAEDMSLNGRLFMTGDASMNKRLFVGSDASINSNLFVNKRTLLNDDVSMNNSLDLSGALIAHNNLNLYGIINQYTLSLQDGYKVNYSNVNSVGDISINGIKLSNSSNGQNTFYGINSGSSITSGINNTFIGYSTGSTTTTGSNNIIIGNGAQGSSVSASNEITLGNNQNSILRCNVQTITSLSDIRDKKNIHKLPVGLDFINDLNPVEFEWNRRDGSKIEGKEFGFIAQELKKSEENFDIKVPNLIYEETPDTLEASYSTLIPIMVNAIKDLKELAAKQQIEIDDLKQKLSA